MKLFVKIEEYKNNEIYVYCRGITEWYTRTLYLVYSIYTFLIIFTFNFAC